MIAEYIRSLEGIEVIGIAALVISFAAFCSILIWALRINKHSLRLMAQMPFNSDSAAHTDPEGDR
jgi:hypothetical protein